MLKNPASDIRAITYEDAEYPELLRVIPDRPETLFIRGSLERLKQYPLAIVGTRRRTSYGKSVTITLCRELARAGFTIVSGLARGIDALAHETAIECGGYTVAVIGSGLDRTSLYPREHWRLSEIIVERGGAIVSEYEPGSSARQHHFPERNRIIAGLTIGTLVVEAPEKSGALITAYQALEYNREVFAVPGSIFEKNSAGTNRLIERGAHVTTSIADIINGLGVELKTIKVNANVNEYTSEEQAILRVLSSAPTHVDSLSAATKLPFSTITATLSVLEMNGLIKDLGGKNYIKL